VIEIGVQIFFSKIEVLHKKCLPRLLVLNDKLITMFGLQEEDRCNGKGQFQVCRDTWKHYW
jgi:hypothetical protein